MGLSHEKCCFIESKIDTLRLLNCQVVALLNVNLNLKREEISYDNLNISAIDFNDSNLPPVEIVCYALVRDIDY